MDLSKIKLNEESIKYFENRNWKPVWDEVKNYMSVENFEANLEAWQSCENDVLFEGIKIIYDSTDFEYSINQEFPVEIEIEGYKVESEFDADDITIHYNGYRFTLPFEKATIADFIAVCKIMGIELKMRKSTTDEIKQ